MPSSPPSPTRPTTSTFEYAPAPESRSIVDIAPSYGLFIDGEFVDGTSEPFKSVNPATEEVLTEVSTASEADVDRAVAAARRAFTRVWGPMRPADRGKYLFRIARLLQERARALEPGQPTALSQRVGQWAGSLSSAARSRSRAMGGCWMGGSASRNFNAAS